MQMHVQNILEMFIGNNMEEKNQKHKQQDLTELNSDGNRERGREGEDLSNIELTKEEEEQFAEEEWDAKLLEIRAWVEKKSDKPANKFEFPVVILLPA